MIANHVRRAAAARTARIAGAATLLALGAALVAATGCAGGLDGRDYGQTGPYWTSPNGPGSGTAGPVEAAGMAQVQTPEAFEDKVLKSELPVLVEFYKPGCGGCMLLAPVLASVQPEYAGHVTFVSIDATRPATYGLVRENKVRVTPTCLVFVGGREVARLIGDRSQGDLRRFIDGAVEKGASS
jgi:thiol-disulfide isomerase/thioredoxin